jgi:signal transduction histidine kinase
MKRRLTLAILGCVAAALLLTGVGTLVLARFGAKQTAEDELRNQAESTARLVDLGQTRFTQLTSRDIEAVRSAVCRGSEPGGTSTGTTSGTAVDGASSKDIQRLRAALCSTSPDVVVIAARSRLCDIDDALTRTLGGPRRAARDAFCKNPSESTLADVRTAFCPDGPADPATPTTPEKGPGAAVRARAEQLRVNLCRTIAVRPETQKNLQNALSKEQIELIVFDAANTVQVGQLPGDLTPADLHPEQLRNGESVSGQVGNGVYAISPIDATTENMTAILISRPSDPVGGLIPWFLLASGVTLLIGLAVATWLGRALTNPLVEAKTVTATIANGDLSVRVPEHVARPGQPRDELDDLAHSINTMAEALDRSRGLERQFLLSVSHDLRTPLTSIRGYAEAIADGTAPDPSRAAGVILAESRRLERLVKDLLDLAKLDARRFTFTIIQLDLNDVATDSVEGFRREVEAAGLAIRLDVPATPTLAYADPDRLQQVIANLVENALKFAATTITVRVASGPAGPEIEVVDDGPGIAAEDLPHVFERLYVTAARPERKEVGSGLGLAIVREVTETMGGHVEAQAASGAGTGTRMVVHLAATPPPTPPAPPAETA